MAPEPDVVVIAQGAVADMRDVCDFLRGEGVDAALTKPPGRGGGG